MNQHLSAKTSRSDTMRALSHLTDDVAKFVPQGARVGYLDYPMHINVGDLLIFMGTMDFFAANGNTLPVAFSIHDVRQRAWRALEDVDVIACHGGGNFGDIYRPHQMLREEVVRRFPHKPIVVLPQSIHFSSADALERSAAVFSAHPNLTILVRDEASFEIARTHFTERVTFMPDMAHRLYVAFASIRAGQHRHRGTLSLMRQDVEAPAGQPNLNAAVDWPDLLSLADKALIGRHRAQAIWRGLVDAPLGSQADAYLRTVSSRVNRMAGRLIEFDHWTTSRLHGAILGNLLDKPVEAYDNSYGKLQRYFQRWGSTLIAFAPDR